MLLDKIHFARIITVNLVFFFLSPAIISAQKNDSTRSAINTFAGAITIQTKGISTIPNLTLGKPAAVFDMKIGRKLTFEPQFRFALDGKPWAMVFWWRYYGSVSNKFKVTFHPNKNKYKFIFNTEIKKYHIILIYVNSFLSQVYAE